MKDKRTFDWGPPPQKGDSFKEALMWFFIGVLFFGGIYFLLDVGKKPSYVAVEEETDTPKKSGSELVYSKEIGGANNGSGRFMPAQTKGMIEPPPVEITYRSEKTNISESKPVYFVQMGAFADENSAKEIYRMLSQINLTPILKQPDEKNSVYRVLVGPFNSEADADYKAEKLNELDLPCFVVEQ